MRLHSYMCGVISGGGGKKSELTMEMCAMLLCWEAVPSIRKYAQILGYKLPMETRSIVPCF